MKKNKKQIGAALLEALGEIVLTLIFFGIGAWIISLFGIKIDSPNIDGDLIVLIGIIAFVVIFAIIWIPMQWIKETIRNKRK